MNKLPSMNILVAAALIGIAIESSRAEEAAPGMSPAPAGQTTASGTGYAPDRYPPRPDQRGYAQPWQRHPQRPAPGYNQLPLYYPPYRQYRAAPAAPAENPLSTTLKETQEQLAAKTTELDTTREKVAAKTTELETTREQLARLQTELQNATAALQKAQSDTLNAGRQVDSTKAQVDTFRKILCELAARIETRKTALHNALQTPAAVHDDPASAAVGEVEPATTEQAEPQTDQQCSQLTPTPAITSGQRGMTIDVQAR